MPRRPLSIFAVVFNAALPMLVGGCGGSSTPSISFTVSKETILASEPIHLSWSVPEKSNVVIAWISEKTYGYDDEDGDFTSFNIVHSLSVDELYAGQISITPSYSTEYTFSVVYNAAETPDELSETSLVRSVHVELPEDVVTRSEVTTRWQEITNDNTTTDATTFVSKHFHRQARQRYSNIAGKLDERFIEVFSSLEDFSPIENTESTSQALVTRTINGKKFASIITFSKDYDGKWYISDM